MKRDIFLRTEHGPLRGRLAVPPGARGLILLAQPHATPLDLASLPDLALDGHAVLAMPLLTLPEMHFPDASHNVSLLAQRLVDTLDLIRDNDDIRPLPVGLAASAQMSPAALRAAAQRDAQVRALACHGGLIDLAGRQYLDLLAAPLLMLVDKEDSLAEASWQRALPHFSMPHELVRLSAEENPGGHVAGWFEAHLQAI